MTTSNDSALPLQTHYPDSPGLQFMAAQHTAMIEVLAPYGVRRIARNQHLARCPVCGEERFGVIYEPGTMDLDYRCDSCLSSPADLIDALGGIDAIWGRMQLPVDTLSAPFDKDGGTEVESPHLVKKASTLTTTTGQLPVNTGDLTGLTSAVKYLIARIKMAESGGDPPDWHVPLALGNLNPRASAQKAVAEKVQTIMGLYLTDGGSIELPDGEYLMPAVMLSGSLIARVMNWDDPDGEGGKRGRKTLDALVRAKVLRWHSSMTPMGGRRYGTRCYQPYDFDLDDFYSNRVLTAVAEEREAA